MNLINSVYPLKSNYTKWVHRHRPALALSSMQPELFNNKFSYYVFARNSYL